MFGSWVPGTYSDVENGVDGSSAIPVVHQTMGDCIVDASEKRTQGLIWWERTLPEGYTVHTDFPDLDFDGDYNSLKMTVTSEYEGEIWQDAFSRYTCETVTIND